MHKRYEFPRTNFRIGALLYPVIFLAAIIVVKSIFHLLIGFNIEKDGNLPAISIDEKLLLFCLFHNVIPLSNIQNFPCNVIKEWDSQPCEGKNNLRKVRPV